MGITCCHFPTTVLARRGYQNWQSSTLSVGMCVIIQHSDYGIVEPPYSDSIFVHTANYIVYINDKTCSWHVTKQRVSHWFHLLILSSLAHVSLLMSGGAILAI